MVNGYVYTCICIGPHHIRFWVGVKQDLTTVFRVSLLVPTCTCRPNMTTTPQLSARAMFISLNSYFHFFFSKMPQPHSPTVGPTTNHAATTWYHQSHGTPLSSSFVLHKYYKYP